MILEFTNAGVGKQRNRATRLCYQSRLFKTDCFDPRALFWLHVCSAYGRENGTCILTLVPSRVWEALDHTVRSESLLLQLYIKQDLLPIEKECWSLTQRQIGISLDKCLWKHLLRRVIVC